MKCPKCGSENVTVTVVNEQQIKNKHHGIFWWLCVGWWWVPIKWLFFTLPALIIAIFVPKKKKIIIWWSQRVKDFIKKDFPEVNNLT